MNIRQNITAFLINVCLLLAGALLFALGFPSFISDSGWAPLAWISLIPVVLLIRRVPWFTSPLWGLCYGYITYALFNFWLATFNPVSFVIVPTVYAGWFFIVFPVLTLADRAFPRYGWLAQLAIWAAYEVLRTKGFLGYSYGILGYSQYGWRALIAIADIFGVMGVSLLTAFPSFLIGGWLIQSGCSPLTEKLFPGSRNGIPANKIFSGRWAVAAGVWASLMLIANVYGLAAKVDYSHSAVWRPALVQHNTNSWLSGDAAWREALDILVDESQKSLNESPDAIIWSETAFVPALEWHLKHRWNRTRADMALELREFSQSLDIPLIIGNNDLYRDAGQTTEYNAALLLDKGKIADRYHKNHLVPFSEHFPYAKTFPRLMEYIQSLDTPLYAKGEGPSVFDLAKWNGPQISPVICFEDTFGYLSRNSVREGGEVLVNLTNDSWSPEAACAVQHQSIAVFRSIENRRSMVRATTSGITCVIDPNGKVIARIDPYTQGYLLADVPIFTDRGTIYTQYGDWFEKVILAAAIVVVLGAIYRLFASGRKKISTNGRS